MRRRRPILVLGMILVMLLLAGAVIRSHRQDVRGVRTSVKESTNPVEKIIDSRQPEVGSEKKQAIAPGNHVYTFETGDGERTYTVYIPKGYDGTKSLPVLIHLHGGLGTAESSDTSTSFSSYADERGFILVYAQGKKGRIGLTSWNAGGCCGSSQEKRDNIDDVGYLKEVITQVQGTFSIDARRMYVSGMSNGSMLANRLACEIPDLIAGVATVSGTTQVSQCNPTRTVQHIIIHGTDDTNVPYYGGKSESPLNNGTFIAVEDEFKNWSKRNACSGDIATTSISKTGKDGTSADMLAYASCPKGKEVVLYRVNGGKHAWPGGRAGTNALERSTSDSLVASKVILDFFGL